MKERPILFSAQMVRAILEGRKTQTRRIIEGIPERFEPDGNMGAISIKHPRRGKFGCLVRCRDFADVVPCPYGQPGDRLWVRENWLVSVVWNKTKPRDIPKDVHVEYQATDDSGLVGRTRPSIYMPRWASRITLEITGIRVERLQDISGPDCWAEGITHDCDKYGSVTHTYQYLWESIKGSGSWDANPFVWVVTFRRIDHA